MLAGKQKKSDDIFHSKAKTNSEKWLKQKG